MGLFDNFFIGLRGKNGERKIANKLGMIDFFGYSGTCLRNLYVPRYDGSTSEIDLVYVTKKGLFIIESKNYSGYIFGNDRAKNWTSTLLGGRTWYGGRKVEKYHFYNPVKQNQSHIKALSNYIGQFYAFSIIVFGDDSELKDISISSPGIFVCNTSDLRVLIKNIWNQFPDVYDDAQVNYICSRLLPLTNANDYVKAAHIQNIKMGNNSLICPRCGGILVLRTAQRGKYQGKSFYGCSNYPKCRFTRNL